MELIKANDNEFPICSFCDKELKQIKLKRIDKKNSQKERKKITSKKIQKWTGIQAIKVFLGIPNIPVK